MKKLLIIAAILFTSCESKELPSQSDNNPDNKVRYISYSATGYTCIITVDSIEYIVVRRGDGVAIAFHRNLKQ